MKKTENYNNSEICRGLVDSLENDLEKFQIQCNQINQATADPILMSAIHDLSINVRHFIDQYRMTDTSISDLNKLRGPKIKHEAREFFRYEVSMHQKKYPGQLPKWEEFQDLMDAFNTQRIQDNKATPTNVLPILSIDSRTYDTWKKWWREGTFDDLVHD